MSQAVLGLCNEALRLLGEIAITSLSEGSELADTCNLLFDTTARGMLASYPWRCTLAKARLGRLSEAPLHNWREAHQLPADLLVLRELAPTAASATPLRAYELFGAQVFSNSPDLWANYQRWVPPDVWPPHVRDAGRAALAAAFAVPVTGSTSLAEQWRRFAYGSAGENHAGGALGAARRVDAQQQPGQRITHFPLMEARLGSTRGWQ